MKVAVLGAGKMMAGILRGLDNTQDLSNWFIYSPSGVSAKKLAESVGAQFAQNLSDIKEPDYVFVACKPQQLKDLKLSLGDFFQEATFVSILAALSESDQLKTLGVQKLIRVMPNLPVEFNEGISLLASGSAPAELKVMEKLFSTLGTSLSVTEEELEELTLLTGSAPAFFYEFALNLSESFTSLDASQREKLARQVMKGAAIAVQNSPDSLSTMTDAVTSKGGVTIAVLEKWRDLKFKDLILAGITAGKNRTNELKAILRS